jgi:hypothetical protein
MQTKIFDNFTVTKEKAYFLYNRAIEAYNNLLEILILENELIGSDNFDSIESIINQKEILLEDLNSINDFLKSNPDIQSCIHSNDLKIIVDLENKLVKQLEKSKQKIAIAIAVNQKMLEIITKSVVSSSAQDSGYNSKGSFKINNKNIISSFGIYNFTV